MSDSAIKWTLVCGGAIIGFTADYLWPGWGRPVLVTIGVFGTLVGLCRDLWSTAYWAVVIGSLSVHVAVMVHWKDAINNIPMPSLFLAVVGELVAIAILVSIVLPRTQGGRRT